MPIIACIEDPEVIEMLFDHRKRDLEPLTLLPEARALPGLFGWVSPTFNTGCHKLRDPSRNRLADRLK
ncbi:hypothetical protein [Thioalkalivibrio sp.]|uniref:hypothetical protein n=1 Tax=Thioalkalivibrio sp. TaxID=2093813 RepID=UPI003976F816